MMILRYCCCCFGFGYTESATTKLLADERSRRQTQKESGYTVHKISSFGRSISQDDDQSLKDCAIGKSSCVIIDKNSAVWSRSSTPTIKQGGGNDLSDGEEQIFSKSQQASPRKRGGHWGKVLSKAKRDSISLANKNATSFQSLASVSMMMLPTITVAGSSTASSSVVGNVDDADTALNASPGSTLNSNATLTEDCLKIGNQKKNGNGWLKSQSMLNVNSGTFISDNESCCPDEKDAVARKFGIDTSLYNAQSKSMDAVNKVWKSMEDYANDEGFVDLPSGSVHFSASYNKTSKKLTIKVEKIEGLAPKGRQQSKYDCVLKLAVLPHAKIVKSSIVIPSHCALNLRENFVFTIKDASKKVLRISVFDSTSSKGDKYNAAGHALFYLEDVLTQVREQESHVMKLYKQSLPDVQPGNIRITLHYEKDTEHLSIDVSQAQHLPFYSGKCKMYVKLRHYIRGKKVKELYSSSVVAAREVNFNYSVEFKVADEDVDDNFIVISVMLKGFLKKDHTIGRVVFGPLLYSEYGKKLTPWGRALITE